MGLFYHIRIAIVFGLLILWSAVGTAGWWRAVIVIVVGIVRNHHFHTAVERTPVGGAVVAHRTLVSHTFAENLARWHTLLHQIRFHHLGALHREAATLIVGASIVGITVDFGARRWVVDEFARHTVECLLCATVEFGFALCVVNAVVATAWSAGAIVVLRLSAIQFITAIVVPACILLPLLSFFVHVATDCGTDSRACHSTHSRTYKRIVTT